MFPKTIQVLIPNNLAGIPAFRFARDDDISRTEAVSLGGGMKLHFQEIRPGDVEQELTQKDQFDTDKVPLTEQPPPGGPG